GAAAGPGRAQRTGADDARRQQWQLAALGADAAWRHATGRGVTVAILDSGVDAGHPDLVGQVLPGLDLVGAGDGRTDPVGHGTTVAGLIAGRRDDARGVVGLAPDAKILPVRVLDADNRYRDAAVVARGVRWAVDRGATVLNLSLGGAADSEVLAEALDYAFAHDVVVIACTGNVHPGSAPAVWYPAREPGVVAVAGLDRTGADRLWRGSNTGPQTVLSAPATGLVGARPGGYWRVQGTSFAAPLVTASAALVRSRWPGMSAGNVVHRLLSTARDLGPPGRDPTYGFGAVDPAAALTADVPPVAGNPLDTAPPPGVTGFGPAAGAAEEAAPRRHGRSPVGGAEPAAGAGAQPSAPPAAAPPAPADRWSLVVGVLLFLALLGTGAVVTRRIDRRGG
ncbi:MAG TPA: type VII secretion-associated serine protease mycosin, partial [Pilimelia sp.]|nr:type VII secretion-associated serine protease mycosin [Pilimelia sp.]